MVRKYEIDKPKESVRRSWLAIDAMEDEFGIDSAVQIELVFDWLEAEQLKIDDCINEFKDFKENNKLIFTEPVRNFVRETYDAFAASFSEVINQELEISHKIKKGI